MKTHRSQISARLPSVLFFRLTGLWRAICGLMRFNERRNRGQGRDFCLACCYPSSKGKLEEKNANIFSKKKSKRCSGWRGQTESHVFGFSPVWVFERWQALLVMTVRLKLKKFRGNSSFGFATYARGNRKSDQTPIFGLQFAKLDLSVRNFQGIKI